MIFTFDHETLAEQMNKLPFVRWDRFVASDEGDGIVYGWIKRPDFKQDFVVLNFEMRDDAIYVGHYTSSAELSHEISRRLHGDDSEHIDCQRVDECFGALVHNKVVLAA